MTAPPCIGQMMEAGHGVRVLVVTRNPVRHDPIECASCGAVFCPLHGRTRFCSVRCCRAEHQPKAVANYKRKWRHRRRKPCAFRGCTFQRRPVHGARLCAVHHAMPRHRRKRLERAGRGMAWCFRQSDAARTAEETA